MDAFFAYLKTLNVSSKDKFGEAVGYALNQERYLRVFLKNGDVPVDNNASERAIIYSIVEIAKANKLKTYDYIQYILEEIPKHMNDTDRSFLKNLLP